MPRASSRAPHTVSIVVPVYRGASTLTALTERVAELATVSTTIDGHRWRVTELILVCDGATDGSDDVIRALARRFDFVRTVWLSRNFGQHPATLAGIAAASGDWVATIDEDGQHAPADVATLLDAAIAGRAQVVYARPEVAAPHGAVRNLASKSAKAVTRRLFSGSNARDFNSFRLIVGDVARGLVARATAAVYLDVALGWIADRYAVASVPLHSEVRPSGYSLRRLVSHFLRLIMSNGTRMLRLVTLLGVLFAVTGVVVIVVIVVAKLAGGIDTEGWASTMVVLLLGVGAILFALGVIAEYVGVTVSAAMGKPTYVVVPDPADGPLGRK